MGSQGHKYVTLEGSFLCFHGQIFLFHFSKNVTEKLHSGEKWQFLHKK